MNQLATEEGVEFLLFYEMGPGLNGGAGQYYLYRGTRTGLDINKTPFGKDIILVRHTHPNLKGYNQNVASGGDQGYLKTQASNKYQSPQRMSEIVTEDGNTFKFNASSPRLKWDRKSQKWKRDDSYRE